MYIKGEREKCDVYVMRVCVWEGCFFRSVKALASPQWSVSDSHDPARFVKNSH